MNKFATTKIFQYYLSHFYILLIITILFSAFGYYYYSEIQVPMYSSSTTVLLVNNKIDTIENEYKSTDYSLNRQLVNTYSEIIKNSDILKNTIAELDLKINESELANNISVYAISNTEIIKIQVANKNNELAKTLADCVTKNFIKKVNEIYNLHNVTLLLEAQVANKPYNVSLFKQTAVVGGIGFVISAAIVFYIYLFDSTVKSASDIEENIKKPVLGKIVKVSAKKKKNDKSEYKELISYENPKSSFAESINSIKANLEFSNLSGTNKTFLFTSANASEGKSLIVANLAVSFAKNNKKVLIIDADLRKGRQHEIFDYSKSYKLGYSKIILKANEKTIDYDKYLFETDIKNVFVLPCGDTPPSPSDLLSSDNNKKLMEKLQKKFDYIFIDCPPSIGFIDAVIMSRFSDVNIAIAVNHKSKLENLYEITEVFEKGGSKITGFILNKDKSVPNKYYKYYK